MKHGVITLYLLCAMATCGAQHQISTIGIAKTVLEKGLKETDLGTYQGSLLLQGMAELAVADKDKNLLKRTIDTLVGFGTNAIQGKGSFVSYKAGGNAAAFLKFLKATSVLDAQVNEAADGMYRKQKRSKEGILTANWASDSNEQVFIDMAFAITPYMLYAGLSQQKSEYVDLAVEETLVLFKILRDNGTKLLHQGRGFNGFGVISEDNWSRGNGWGALAIATLIRDLPGSHPKRKEVEALAKEFFTAVIKYQDKSGLWHQEMTAPDSFTETSGSGLLLYGLGIVLEKGLLKKDYTHNFLKGLKGITSYIAADGGVSHACYSCLCPRKGRKEDYVNHVWLYNDAHAFGPVVLLFAQAFKMGFTSFTVSEKPGSKAVLDTTAPVTKTYVRYVPERSQDIAWENDLIAFRYYGPPVRDKVSSGIDVWSKSVGYSIIDKWYRLNARGEDYHVDRGEGSDFYHMGFMRGSGGTAIWKNNKPYVSTTYASHRIDKNETKAIRFVLNFDAWNIDDITVSEQKIITMVNGTNFFKVVSTIQSTRNEDIVFGIGLTTFGNPSLTKKESGGLLSAWEKIDPQKGSIGTAVVIDPGKMAGYAKSANDEYILLKVKTNQPFTYYVGAGWEGNSAYKQPGAWEKMIQKDGSWGALNKMYRNN